jgi:Phage integrase family
MLVLVRQLRDYLHQVCHSTEMLRAGVSFPVLMKLLGHTDPEMTMRYVDVALTDLQREFHQARAHPKYLVPQPKASSIPLRAGLDGVIDFFARLSTCVGDVSPPATKRHFPLLSRPALQPTHQDPHRRPQTAHNLRLGRDWPVKPVIRPRSANTMQHIFTNLAVHIRVCLPRAFL